MSRRQRIRRTTLAALAACCAGVWVAALWLLLAGAATSDSPVIVAALWASGLPALGLTVAACRITDDSTDDPAYFASIVQGIRAEWQRPSTRL